MSDNHYSGTNELIAPDLDEIDLLIQYHRNRWISAVDRDAKKRHKDREELLTVMRTGIRVTNIA